MVSAQIAGSRNGAAETNEKTSLYSQGQGNSRCLPVRRSLSEGGTLSNTPIYSRTLQANLVYRPSIPSLCPNMSPLRDLSFIELIFPL